MSKRHIYYLRSYKPLKKGGEKRKRELNYQLIMLATKQKTNHFSKDMKKKLEQALK